MIRSIDLLLKRRWLSNLATSALVLLIIAMIAIGSIELFRQSAPVNSEGSISIAIGLLLGATLAIGLITMLLATWIILKRRQEVSDFGIFLAITWLLPYIGVITYIGCINVFRLISPKEE